MISNMKKISTYQKFNEELRNPRRPFLETTKEEVRKHLRSLGMEREVLVKIYKNTINDLLKLLSTSNKDVNDEYQLPLSLLYQTKKFKIEKIGDQYHSDLLTNISKVIDSEGNWSFVNKLNTNYSDLFDFIVDYICQTGKIRDVLTQKTLPDLTKYLEDKKKYFLTDFQTYFDIEDLYNYTQNAQRNTELGEKSEGEVISFLENSGIKIVYQGGNGDVIDMLMGVDLIGQDRNGNVYTFQVKSSKNQILTAIKDRRYTKINMLIYPINNGFEGYSQGTFYTFNLKGFTTPYPGKPILSILRQSI